MNLVYWDSCCILNYLQNTQDGNLCDGVIKKAERDENFKIATSAMAVAEVRSLEHKKSGLEVNDSEKEIIRNFFNSTKIMVIDISRISAIETRENYWLGRNLKPADALHVAAAEYLSKFHKVTHFHTFDKQILAISEIGQDQAIKVCKPSLDDFPYQESFTLTE